MFVIVSMLISIGILGLMFFSKQENRLCNASTKSSDRSSPTVIFEPTTPQYHSSCTDVPEKKESRA